MASQCSKPSIRWDSWRTVGANRSDQGTLAQTTSLRSSGCRLAANFSPSAPTVGGGRDCWGTQRWAQGNSPQNPTDSASVRGLSSDLAGPDWGIDWDGFTPISFYPLLTVGYCSAIGILTNSLGKHPSINRTLKLEGEACCHCEPQIRERVIAREKRR